MINVNKLFGRTFEKGEKIKVTVYKTGPYYGMDFPEMKHTVDYAVVPSTENPSNP